MKRKLHMVIDGVECKQCASCGEWLPLDAFGILKTRWDGRNPYCIECNRVRQTQWARDHRNVCSERHKQWYAKNRDATLERAKQWRAEHPEYVGQWYQEHRQEHIARGHQWRAEHVLKAAEYRRRRHERKAPGAEYTTAEKIAARWEMFGNRCWICGAPATQTDHVKPLAKGGAHLPCNLRPICKPCNAKKNAKWPYPVVMSREEAA